MSILNPFAEIFIPEINESPRAKVNRSRSDIPTEINSIILVFQF